MGGDVLLWVYELPTEADSFYWFEDEGRGDGPEVVLVAEWLTGLCVYRTDGSRTPVGQLAERTAAQKVRWAGPIQHPR